MDLSQDLVREVLHYDPETGIFTWLPRDRSRFNSDSAMKKWHSSHCGKEAGCLHTKKPGYQVRVIGINNRLYLAHRLAFIYMTGEEPRIVDHLDGDASNNRWNNLSPSNYAGNAKNCFMSNNNTSGVSGVSWDKRRSKWSAKVMVNRKTINLGRFDCIDYAEEAVIKAKRNLAFSERHGKEKR